MLWITSFNDVIYEHSARHFINTFIASKTEGTLVCTFNDLSVKNYKYLSNYLLTNNNIKLFNLDSSSFLQMWRFNNQDLIPPITPCNCPDPDAKDERKHLLGCHYAFFNRNTYRWVNKIASLEMLCNFSRLKHYPIIPNKDKFIIWIDADCYFKQQVTYETVKIVFQLKHHDVFYLKGQRKILEGGLVGYNLNMNAEDIIKQMVAYYTKGFRGFSRWDDCYILQKSFSNRRKYTTIDLCQKADIQNFSDVFKYSKVFQYIYHDKGKHSRKLGLFH